MIESLVGVILELARAGWLPSAFAYPFMARAALAGLLLAPLLGTVSPLVVTKRLAFLSSALGHAALTGIALGVLLGESPDRAYVGLHTFCLAMALGITWVRLHSRLGPDTVVGVSLSFTLGLGVCLLALVTRRFDIHQIESLMFGNLVTLTEADLGMLVLLGVPCLLILLCFYDRLFLAALHPSLARTWGVAVHLLEYVFMVVLTLVVVSSLKVIGFLLVEGLVVVPAAASRNLTRSLRGYVLGSVLIALFATELGLWLSFVFPVPTGAAITLVLAAVFGASLVVGGLVRGRVGASFLVLPLSVGLAATSAGRAEETVAVTLPALAGLAAPLLGPPGRIRLELVSGPGVRGGPPTMAEDAPTRLARSAAVLTLGHGALGSPHDSLFGVARRTRIRVVELDPSRSWTDDDPPLPRIAFLTPGPGPGRGPGCDARPGINPRLWMAPTLAGRLAMRLAHDLARLDPRGADSYRSRAEAMARRMAAIRNRALSRLIETDARLVVLGDELDYLLADLDLVPVARLDPEASPLGLMAEARARGWTALVQAARGRRDAEVSRALAATGLTVAVLDTMEGLTVGGAIPDFEAVLGRGIESLVGGLTGTSGGQGPAER